MTLKPFCAALLALEFAACATTKPVSEAGAPTPSATAATGTAAAPSDGPVRWTGSLQPMQQRTGGLGPTGQNKAFGNVSLTSRGPERTAVSISLSTPLQSSTALSWAVLPGRCGTGSLPIAGIERFPVIEVGANGRGQLESEMSLGLPTSGTYHVNIYWGSGSQLSDVMTCANLRKS
ncbi:MAG TPA: hypothetical protein VHM24_00105 [Gemmatimonadaceae bacterium]|nr:hypothetical protein [Gemmatimonadaceae bacterium]